MGWGRAQSKLGTWLPLLESKAQCVSLAERRSGQKQEGGDGGEAGAVSDRVVLESATRGVGSVRPAGCFC